MIFTEATNLRVGTTQAITAALQNSSFVAFWTYLATTISSVITGSVGLIKNGSGTLTLSGANTYNGTTTISAGALVFQNKATRTGGSLVTAAAAGTVGLGVGGGGVTDYSDAEVASLFNSTLSGFTLNAASGVAIDTTAGSFTQSTALTAARELTKLGSNTLTLSGNNTYTGTTTVNAGTLRLQAAVTGFYNTNRTYNINNGSRLIFAAGAATNPALHGTIINIDSNGGATITLDNINGLIQSITGIIFNSNGGLQNRLVSINGFFNDQGGTRPVVFNIASGSNATADFWADCGVIGRCELTKNGSGKLLFSGGLLGTFGDGVTNIRINSGTMEIGGTSAAFLNQKSGSLFLNNGTFIWNSTAANQSIINAISGTGDVIKRNSGTLIFSANNSYLGATSIEAGTLRVTTLISGTSGKFSQANFTNTALTVTFSVAPLAGETYRLFSGATTQSYPTVSLVGATGRTAIYDSLNSTLTIA